MHRVLERIAEESGAGRTEVHGHVGVVVPQHAANEDIVGPDVGSHTIEIVHDLVGNAEEIRVYKQLAPHLRIRGKGLVERGEVLEPALERIATRLDLDRFQRATRHEMREDKQNDRTGHQADERHEVLDRYAHEGAKHDEPDCRNLKRTLAALARSLEKAASIYLGADGALPKFHRAHIALGMILGVGFDVFERDTAVLHADLVENQVERLDVDGVVVCLRALLGVDAKTVGHVLLVTENPAFLDVDLTRDTHHTEVGKVHEDNGQVICIGLVPS